MDGGAHQAEVQDLDHVDFVGDAAHVQVGGFDVAMNESCVVRFRQRIAGLNQEIDHARRRLRIVLLDQGLEVHAVEQFHHVETGAVGGDAVVEELDGVA